MTTSNLNKRLEILEGQIKRAADSPVWIDGKDNVIRVDVNGKRGETLTFSTTREAANWLEGIIDKHPQAAGSYSVDRLWELYRNPEALHEAITTALQGRVFDVGGIKYSKDDFYGMVFGNLKPGAADLKLWLLCTPLTYFDTREFRARFQAQQTSEDDERMFAASYALFAWERPGASVEDFWQLVRQVTRLQPA